MARSKTVYECNQCGYQSAKWNGRCPDCGAWNSFEESTPAVVVKGKAAVRTHTDMSDKILELSEIDINSDVRYRTGVGELDRVLGGGLVKGSIVLLGGAPGIGKSTLLLQICQHLGKDHSVLYISGEESARQIKVRADRLSVDSESLYLLTVTDAEAICDTISETEPDIVIIDSIQTMSIQGITSGPGSLTQVRECTNLFMHTAKSLEIPIIIVGHINKDGAIAGPKVMEHIVDAVLYFEGDRNLTFRILRTVKNRYGSTNEIGVFEMCDKGLKEVENPSLMLLEGRPENVSGTCITCTMEGLRPILAEVQVLATKSGFAAPRRTSKGYDFNRMVIIIAVLEKRAGLCFSSLDVYLNVVGGFSVTETAGDLAVALCLYSSVLDKPLSPKVTAFGEIGLGGEVRAVSKAAERIREAERMGFEICILPRQSLRGLNPKDYKVRLIGVSNISEAFRLFSGK